MAKTTLIVPIRAKKRKMVLIMILAGCHISFLICIIVTAKVQGFFNCVFACIAF